MRALIRLVVAGALVLSTTAHAQSRPWWELYDEAIKHIQAQEWGQAENKLNQARTEGPSSGRRVFRYGSLRLPFFPEYYLGIVYQATARPQLAVEQFQLARKNKVDTGDAEFRQIGIFEGLAKTAMANAKNAPAARTDPAPAPPPAPPTVESPKTPSGPPPNYAAEFADLMTSARSQLSQRNYESAERTATSARDLAIKQGLSTEQPRAESLLREIAGARFAARVEAAISKGDAPLARSELTVLVVAAPEYRTDSLRERVEQLERQSRTSDLLRTALRSFFTGSYDKALSLLDEMERITPLPARGHFYRACSLAALAAATANPSQDRRLAAARRSYAASTAGSNEFREDLRYISPKIRQLLGIQ